MHYARVLAALAVPAVLSLAACDSAGDGQMATARIRLTDAPSDSLTRAFVRVKTVRLVGADSTDSFTLDVNKDYDLMTLRNGLETTLGTVRIPAGSYSGIRIVVGDSATVTEKHSGQTYTVKIPSGSTSGIKINRAFTVRDSTSILLDFDVNTSFHRAGNSGKYIFRPTVLVKSQTSN